MKIPASIAALVFACGSAAIAAQAKDAEAGASYSTVAASDQKAGGGVVDKTKDALRRMGDKMRSTGNRISDKVANQGGQKSTVRDGEQDTRAMGASPAEQARQARMDEAYSNWQAKQK